ncbi:hypothetical protein ACFWY5_40855 [Nonomuraea sp. NPDC059007]|uniref:hypothetical protein n=1 Tax=Nonomuraea sp. NPDC059007 TaxID=3346692 RepID=UPI00368C93AE
MTTSPSVGGAEPASAAAVPSAPSRGPTAMGERSAVVDGDNPGVVITGDVHLHPASSPVKALAGLPAAPPDFTGRGEILAALNTALDPGRPGADPAAGAATERPEAVGAGSTAVLVHAVAGMAGMGKTALALVAAHQALAAGWFAGGVFFCDLHGYTPGASEPVEAFAVAGQVLRAMGLRPEELPATADEVLAVYRSVPANLARQERGVLVVADNAASAGQVRALIPAHCSSGSSAALCSSVRSCRLVTATPAARSPVLGSTWSWNQLPETSLSIGPTTRLRQNLWKHGLSPIECRGWPSHRSAC